VKWEQGRLIGQGGFGKVFHALNLDTGEMMAVKQVPIGSAANTRGMEALQHEIELLKDLEHENIVQYLVGCEITETTINVFLEYVSGGSISSVLSKCGKFDTIYCQSFATQILCGLDYLHQKNIIHRDIKGANILVDQHGVAKITDFGISKKNDYMAYQRMTRMSMQGSINWMAPEVARGGKGYSAKVDIWSLGCLVLEMVSGHYPWHKVRGNIIYLLGTGNAPPLPSNINQMTQDFLNKCFTIDPEKRPTALDMLKHNFCDVNIETLNFTNWARDAQERRIQNGDSSEEESEDDDEEEESQDFETRLNKSSDDEWVVEQSPAVGYPDISYLLDHPELLQEDSD
ncbi:kinase-like domain-containing protein, partial [Gorgonomyces haynaldii]